MGRIGNFDVKKRLKKYGSQTSSRKMKKI